MALTYHNCIGLETGGTEEAGAITGSPTIVTSATVTMRTGTYALQVDDGEIYNMDHEVASDAGTDRVIGFAMRVADTTPVDARASLARARDGATSLWEMDITSGGDLVFQFISGDDVTVSDPLTVDTWHWFEILWQEVDSGNFIVHMDGSEIVNVSARDMNDGGGHGRYNLRNNDATAVYFDDMYCASAAAGTASVSDFIGTNASVIGPYSQDTEDATDQGDALDTGQWNDIGELVWSETAFAQYSTDPSSGYTRTDETGGSVSGPAADITGTSKFMKISARMKRGTGGGSTHSLTQGKFNGSTDSTLTPTVTLGTGYANRFWKG